LNFVHPGILGTRENDGVEQSRIVTASVAKDSATLRVCVAVIGDINVRTKTWTAFKSTIDSPVLLFTLHRNYLGRNVVGIRQYENKTLLTVIRLPKVALIPELPVSHLRFPLQRSDIPENIPFSVQNRDQSV
jgi:hypothetical protein